MTRVIWFVFFMALAAWFVRDLSGGESLSFWIVNRGTISRCHEGDGYACWWLGLLKKRSGERTAETRYYQLACDKGYGKGCFRLSTFAEAEGRSLVARDLAKQACAKGAWEGCFNVACYLSRDNDVDGALSYLQRAMRSGLAKERNFRAQIANERDFDNIRTDPRFEEITLR